MKCGIINIMYSYGPLLYNMPEHPIVKRDLRGRVLPGSASPGTGAARYTEHAKLLRQAMKEVLDIDAARALVRRAMELANQNDDLRVAASMVELLMTRMGGKPPSQVDIDVTHSNTIPAFDPSRLSDDQVFAIADIIASASTPTDRQDDDILDADGVIIWPPKDDCQP